MVWPQGIFVSANPATFHARTAKPAAQQTDLIVSPTRLASYWFPIRWGPENGHSSVRFWRFVGYTEVWASGNGLVTRSSIPNIATGGPL
jgi:hypothetical protein